MKQSPNEAYNALKSKRIEITQRQREEYKRELAPFEAKLGEAIKTAYHGEGLSVVEIANAMGTKNRNLVYAYIDPHGKAAKPVKPKKTFSRDGNTAVLTLASGEVLRYGLTTGQLDLPDAWLEERQDWHKDMVRELRTYAAGQTAQKEEENE